MWNSSVYVRNKNQGEYTKNTHCEKKLSNNQGIEWENKMSGNIYFFNQSIQNKTIM